MKDKRVILPIVGVLSVIVIFAVIIVLTCTLGGKGKKYANLDKWRDLQIDDNNYSTESNTGNTFYNMSVYIDYRDDEVRKNLSAGIVKFTKDSALSENILPDDFDIDAENFYYALYDLCGIDMNDEQSWYDFYTTKSFVMTFEFVEYEDSPQDNYLIVYYNIIERTIDPGIYE